MCQNAFSICPFSFSSSPALIAPVCLSILFPLSVHMSSVPKLINGVVLLILLTALSDPEQYHLTSAELANDLDVMDDASK